MLAQLTLLPALPKTLNATHLLVLLPKAKALSKDIPHGDLLASVLKRRDMKAEELAKSPVAANAANGALVVWAMLDPVKDTFALQTQVRKALQLLLEEQPKNIAIAVSGSNAQRAAELAVYGAWVNASLLPVHKKKDERKALQKIELVNLNGPLPPALTPTLSRRERESSQAGMGVNRRGEKVSTPTLTLPLQGGGKNGAVALQGGATVF